MSKGFLLDREMLNFLSNMNDEGAKNLVGVLGDLGVVERVITKKLFEENFEKIRSFLINDYKEDEINAFFGGINYLKKDEEKELEEDEQSKTGKVKLISAPAFPQKKVEVKDFVNHFRSRYEMFKKIFDSFNLENLTTIKRLGFDRANYTLIAIVSEKTITKNKNLLIQVEDLTGKSTILVNANKKEVFDKAKDLLLDDIVAFEVTGSREMLFASNIIFPQASLEEKRKSSFDEYIAVIGDLHVGSTMFLEKNFLKFIKWVNGEEGSAEQRAIAKKVKYLFFMGDNVDGINQRPGQEPFLNINTTLGQYKKVEEFLRLFRPDVQMVMIPGQHDMVWVGEPQQIIPHKYAPGLHDLGNLHLVPNPCIIEIDGGFKILIYHGGSINSLIEEIPGMRIKYGHNSPTMIVKEMLKRRHLAPTHGLVDYIPCERDPMVIDIIPDVVLTGDQHRAEASTFNNILMISGSCFQSITPFEEKVGNNPDPCKIPLFNLKTREIKIMDFSGDSKNVGGEKVEPAVIEDGK